MKNPDNYTFSVHSMAYKLYYDNVPEGDDFYRSGDFMTAMYDAYKRGQIAWNQKYYDLADRGLKLKKILSKIEK